jgi:O-methyltransferase involved in polyketide biosynthesis
MIHVLAEHSALYREKQQELLNDHFTQVVLEQKVDAWADLLRNEVAEAHQTDSAHVAPASWEGLVTAFKDSLVAARQALVEDIDEYQP